MAYRRRRKAVELCGRNGCAFLAAPGAYYCERDAEAHRQRMRKYRARKRQAESRR